MEIITSTTKYSIVIDEGADINDTLDGIVAALQLEGFSSPTIYQALVGKAESMDMEHGFSEENI